MRRALAAAALLCLAAAAGAALGGAAATHGGGNTTTALQLDGETRSDVATPVVDLSAALDTQHDDLALRLDRGTLRAALASTDSTTAQRAALVAAVDRAEDRTTDLLAAEARARQRYANGTIDRAALFTTLARLNERADGTREMLTLVRNRTQQGTEVGQRAQSLRAALDPLTGPVRDRVADAVRGGDTDRVYAGATADGLVLATVDSGTYYRGAHRVDHRDEASGGLDLRAARNRAAALYPWVFSTAARTEVRAVTDDRYLVTADHDHGRLRASLDGTTEAVFRETQTKNLSQTPLGPTVAQNRGDLRLVVTRTHRGGPFQVRVTNETGAPVEANVRVDDVLVGRTTDGELYGVAPGGADDFVIVEAAVSDQQVSTAVVYAGEDS
jgi:hypothetical protein